MLRRATTTGSSMLVATALTVGLTACSTDPGDDGRNGSSPTGNALAQPGRHSGLPEPCGAPSEERLRQLLPEADAEVLRGEPHMTYDTGRRYGCDWVSSGGDASRTLTVDFLRVISYDPEVSDNDLAAEDFARRAETAGIDLDGGPGTTGSVPGTDAEDPADDRESSGDPDATGDDEGNDPTPQGSEDEVRPEGEYAPRALQGIGTAAYVDDRLTDDGGRRDVSLVFHSANVIVAIDYSEALSDSWREPDSAALQERVSSLASQLAERFDN
ncbi:DUF3558 domain-containing protein [Streptomyces spiramenti]|uniref:DUF3558 domain-containing protein n=1 Tax=Streptomyces spiramenti TaxID=2720606 RepID=A0ABX1APD4_9ACTN|nr:DUF3558 domain-containing protein [Streptomyces spiramenti]NJP67996.1 DUF3558 domain-containing protein [Streptomyces spiramenti]